MQALEFHLGKLADERSMLTERVAALIGEDGREVEIKGYLVMIDRVNQAAIELASQTPVNCAM